MSDICLLKYKQNGENIKGCSIGGAKTDRGFDMLLDRENNIRLCGSITDRVDLNSGIEEQIVAYEDNKENGFILHLDNDLNYNWHRSFYQHNIIICTALTTDKENNIIATGVFHGRLNTGFGSNKIKMTSEPISDVFYTKLSSNGNIIWLKTWPHFQYQIKSCTKIRKTDFNTALNKKHL